MVRISLLSDTHSFIDSKILSLCEGSDEIWHAGDIGDLKVTEALQEVARVRAVFGNIDDSEIRKVWPLNNRFTCEKVDVWITHIGGYPKRYSPAVKPEIYNASPDLFISGHSHILKVMRDNQNDLLHMNPGAIGKHGFHKLRTMLRFKIEEDRIFDLEVIELKR